MDASVRWHDGREAGDGTESADVVIPANAGIHWNACQQYREGRARAEERLVGRGHADPRARLHEYVSAHQTAVVTRQGTPQCQGNGFSASICSATGRTAPCTSG